jgi:hypothetical protein
VGAQEIEWTARWRAQLLDDVGVDHGRLDVRVAEILLNLANVDTVEQQVGGKAMPERFGVGWNTSSYALRFRTDRSATTVTCISCDRFTICWTSPSASHVRNVRSFWRRMKICVTLCCLANDTSVFARSSPSKTRVSICSAWAKLR